ncbi:MAG: hypothetical protein A2821_02880 [Candidatus Magasanikbacteria bacterium RIFCSPHIGHO2_01_FULL_41_23]|uniref:DUF5667 domain-containing protein n=1 Tax=Candidatus Magasanikbacteria bacterium RIFCSPLOWO2_01_FULL_40_15 TaxID=1798686 RepID=A0A1F6N3M4_9BACT|nr:MAG: hypothetical protein A2821_02880 [Candidatus Magasanikbacteria bacterium RIFCSPHIGHO2_01_FULL_41_23]OGH67282.1 MAG: hypothetical protein A3C66_00895 [Candidatus Magasanikbacteria bacterium RIFCSPHIGHO2_02_FULL_41_35]OGH76507.1 MAG: hypothetical protein A3F22_00105 [Candidatus Magasanikbacteria bacterium RIFCSPHIGHO2_12_FULL_41_16]OGH78507.1 MAG: hypothetical protein A2983_03250 [Candidatus Magasanikbacteria bacterium RIFCSPLOWO2_01_FULL_40_15]
MNHVKRQLRQIKEIKGLVNPDLFWVTNNRARLLQQINNTVVPIEKPIIGETARVFWFQFRSSTAFRVMRPVLTALTVAALATSGWIASVSASFNSLPGDRLWAVKRAAQNTEVAVKSFGASNDRKVQLQLNLAKNRVDDIKKAVAQKLINTSPSDLKKAVKDLSVATQDVQTAVKQVSSNIVDQEKVATTKNNQLQVVETVKDVAKDTNNLTKELTSTIVSSTAAGAEVTKQVLETVRVVNQTSINAIEVAVRNQDELSKSGGETGSARNIVSEKVADLVRSNEALTQEVKNTNDDLKIIVAAPTGTAAIIVPNVSSTLPATLTTKEISREAEEKITATRESVADIRKNIDSGNLQEAVNGLRALNESAVTAQQLLVKIKTKVEIDKR